VNGIGADVDGGEAHVAIKTRCDRPKVQLPSVASRVAVIINPISGLGVRPDTARQRAELAAACVEAHRVKAEIFVTERRHHARELTEAALARGVEIVIAWGGDGTVNEVASVLVHREAALGVVPSGSGNGLARELGLPFEPRAAFERALVGRRRQIDAGELGGHLFFNVAGVGLDADVAHRFAASGQTRRGLSMYIVQATAALLSYKAEPMRLTVNGDARDVRPLLIAFANARQYGNGALIAPHARVDDGRLDVVVIDDRPLLGILRRVPALFQGRLASVPGVSMETAVAAQVIAKGRMRYHVDGEPCEADGPLGASVRAGALSVCA
jgi:YegS/Rv2252/BmrU family lipid kinase